MLASMNELGGPVVSKKGSYSSGVALGRLNVCVTTRLYRRPNVATMLLLPRYRYRIKISAM